MNANKKRCLSFILLNLKSFYKNRNNHLMRYQISVLISSDNLLVSFGLIPKPAFTVKFPYR
ncbi:MAG: hypothetical protein DRI94_03565 [Bacteroidetes bacterium]|nr:MAG: hypothetical protein DRI94_03565 [Bacteroidota bacterium]